MKRVLAVFVVLVFLVAPSSAQTQHSLADKRDLQAFVNVLTSDSLAGRAAGTPGQWKASNFIAQRFRELGLAPVEGNDYHENFDLVQSKWGQVYLKTPTKTLDNFVNMVFQGSNYQQTEIEREVVFGGTGTEEELDQINVKDRFVLVFVPNVRATYDVNSRLGQRNAAGVIVANPANPSQFEAIRRQFKEHYLRPIVLLPHMVVPPDTLMARWAAHKLINVITIPNAEIQTIGGLAQKQMVELAIRGRIREAPVTKVRVRFERIRTEMESANVVGVLKGKSDKMIVVSAHYDHLGKVGEQFYPGADDNASGVAALLELAEEFSARKDLPHNILFLATSAEEEGLLGARYHVNQPDFKPENILCNINLDMIGRVDGKHKNPRYLYCIGTDQLPSLHELIKKADHAYNRCTFDFSLDDSKDPFGLYTRSDSYVFYKKGIPAIQFFSGFHQDYHKPGDTADKIDFQNLEYRVHQIAVVVDMLQKEGGD